MNMDALKHIRLVPDSRCAQDTDCCASLKKIEKFVAHHANNFYQGEDKRIYVLVITFAEDVFYMDAVTGSLYNMEGQHQSNDAKTQTAFKKCTKAKAKERLISQFKYADEVNDDEA